MGIDDITKKAQDLLNDNKVKDALQSDKAEEVSDKLLDGVAGAANKVTGGKFEEQINSAKEKADKAVGNDGKVAGNDDQTAGNNDQTAGNE